MALMMSVPPRPAWPKVPLLPTGWPLASFGARAELGCVTRLHRTTKLTKDLAFGVPLPAGLVGITGFQSAGSSPPRALRGLGNVQPWALLKIPFLRRPLSTHLARDRPC